jgi:predicted dehydrogenase
MKLRIAVIGLGRIGSRYDEGRTGRVARSHVGAILREPACELVGVCDSSLESRECFRRDWGNAIPTHRSIAALLSKVAADVFVVATPAESHRRVIERLVGARPRLIFCEKPFCATLGDAQAARALAARRRVPVIVNYHRRWDPRFRRLASRFHRIGPPAFVQVAYRKGLMNYGSHTVDLLQQFFGAVTRVEAESTRSALADPSYSATLTFASGLKARMSGIDAVRYELMDFEIFYSGSKYRLALGGFSVERFQPERGAAIPGYVTLPELGTTVARWPVSGLSEAYHEIPRILRAASRVEYATAASAVGVHRVLHAIRVSARSGRAVVP